MLSGPACVENDEESGGGAFRERLFLTRVRRRMPSDRRDFVRKLRRVINAAEPITIL
jgi:hypothetical protein